MMAIELILTACLGVASFGISLFIAREVKRLHKEPPLSNYTPEGLLNELELKEMME